MDLGRPPLARFPEGDVRLGHGIVTAEDIETAVAQVGIVLCPPQEYMLTVVCAGIADMQWGVIEIAANGCK
jgi:hypothetical protein